MNKVILVTGASCGFGQMIAEQLAACGHRVFGTSRRPLPDMGQVRMLVLDITDEALVERAVTQVIAEAGRIDVLINNAGVGLCGAVEDTTLAEAQWQMDTNFFGPVRMIRAVLPHMRSRNYGKIINIGSTAGEWPYPGGNTYGATKAFVRQFSLNLRADLAGTALRVTDVEPGLCAGTEFSNVRFHGDDEKAAKVYQDVQALTAEDIADTVHWIATRPAHVNVNTIELMPVAQSFADLTIQRG